MKNIYIDCSYLSEHIELNTGIQRVVRRVIENLKILSKDGDFEIIPVDISNSKFKQIDIETLFPKDTPKAESTINISLKNYLKNLYRALRDFLAALIPSQKFRAFLYATKDEFGLRYIVEHTFVKPIKLLTSKEQKSQQREERGELVIKKGDILLLLDSTWYMNIWPTVGVAKANGATIVAVIYDLIPITHSQFCDDFLAQVFKEWFFNSLEYVQGYIAISDTVKSDLKSFLHKEFGKEKIKDKRFDYFLLGADFGHSYSSDSQIRKELKDMFKTKDTYLIVCTIEPRKNHNYLLDVFDKLWESGIEVNLSIVGRVGWKVEETIARIQNHKLLNKNLFFWSDLNDKELLYCYENSKMLLFPSIVEGFGLPIVESLSNSLPVLASDTPIHREVGGDSIDYFDIEDTQTLVNQIIAVEKKGIPEKLVVKDGYKWYSWYQSSEMLLRKIMSISK